MDAGVPLEIVPAQSHVDAVALKGDRSPGSEDVQLYVRMPLIEIAEPWYQPFHRDGRFAGDDQRQVAHRLAQRRHCRVEVLERVLRGGP